MEALPVRASEWSERAATLKDEGWMVADLCGVDRYSLAEVGARFEVVVTLLHIERKERLCVHVLAEGDPPTVPSVTALWATANFMEREAFDMFGITFEGHPNLTRILMPEEWEGYPLRKDYGVGKVPVEFVPQPFLQIDAPGQRPNVEEAGDQIDALGQMRTRTPREAGP